MRNERTFYVYWTDGLRNSEPQQILFALVLERYYWPLNIRRKPECV